MKIGRDMNPLCLVIMILVSLIAINFFWEFNIGPPAVLCALLIGKIYLGFDNSKIIGMIPGSTLFTMIVISGFYGFALENGTAHLLIQKLLNGFGHRAAFIPVLIFGITILLSGAGLGSGNATMIMAPFALGIAGEAAISPLVMAMAVSCGSAIGSNFPFSFGGAIAVSLIEEGGYMASGTAAMYDAALKNTVIQTISFLIIFFWKRGFSNQGMAEKEIVRMTDRQKKTGILIGAVVCASIGLSVLSGLCLQGVMGKITGFLDIHVVLLVGIILAMAGRLADEREVIRKYVPWMLIVVISGVSMLIGIARFCGVVEILGNIFTMNISVSMMPYAVLVTGMLMSLFGGTISIVVPTLFPMVPGIVSGTGLESGGLFGCVLNGATCGGISPYSSGGMILLGAYTGQHSRRKFLAELMVMPFYQIAVAAMCYMIFF